MTVDFNKVKALLQQGELQEAFELLEVEFPIATNLLAQLKEGETACKSGVIEYDEFFRIKSRITQVALALVQ